MPFFSGATDMDALIDLMADQLIATGAWGTADGTLVAGAHPAKRAVTHLTDVNFFVMFDRNLVTAGGNASNCNEIRIQISTGFNTGTHVPSGTIQTTGIPCEAPPYGTGAMAANNKLGSHWTWIDAAGITTLNTWAASAQQDFTVFFTLERNTAKEYADGYTNFFCAQHRQREPQHRHQQQLRPILWKRRDQRRLRLAARNHPAPVRVRGVQLGQQQLGEVLWRLPVAGQLEGVLRVPFFSDNQTPLQRSPIAQTLRFFLVQPGQGLADGDLVTYVSGPNTYSYLVKTLQSPDSTNYSPWGIRQA